MIKKSRKNTKFVIAFSIIFTAFLAFMGCSDPSSTSTSTSSSGSSSSSSTSTVPAATTPVDSSSNYLADSMAWPFNYEDHVEKYYGLPTDFEEELDVRNFLIVLDDSGSMGGSKMRTAKKAIIEWSKSFKPTDNVGLITFKNRSEWLMRKFDSDAKASFDANVQDVDDGGSTPLTGALSKAFIMLTRQGMRQLSYGDYTIVVVTDGEADEPRSLNRTIDKVLTTSPVQIFAIGFGVGENHTLNQQSRLEYLMADDLDALRQGLSEVLAESDTFDDGPDFQ